MNKEEFLTALKEGLIDTLLYTGVLPLPFDGAEEVSPEVMEKISGHSDTQMLGIGHKLAEKEAGGRKSKKKRRGDEKAPEAGDDTDNGYHRCPLHFSCRDNQGGGQEEERYGLFGHISAGCHFCFRAHFGSGVYAYAGVYAHAVGRTASDA